jgi:hypothetical protein
MNRRRNNYNKQSKKEIMNERNKGKKERYKVKKKNEKRKT